MNLLSGSLRVYQVFLFIFLMAGFQACKTGGVAAGKRPVKMVLDTMEVTVSRNPEYRASETRIADLTEVKLYLEPDFATETMNGRAALRLMPFFYPTDSLIIDAKKFNIEKVSLVRGADTIPLIYKYPDSLQLKIKLDRTYQSSETFELLIAYRANPKSFSGGSQAITSDKGLYFVNSSGKDKGKPVQLWTQGETESASAWFPCIDKPNERCIQELTVVCPDSFQSLSNGLLLRSVKRPDGKRADTWKMDLPHAPYLFMLALGKFHIEKDRWRNIPVEYWVEPAYADVARKIFGNTPEMMEFFSKKLKYNFPWPKYTSVIVRDYVSGAMENTTASLFGEFMQRSSAELIDENHEDIVAHELFHQWFGDLVTCESWSNLSLNESFATYGEYLWNEHKYGKEYADHYHLEYRDKYLEEANYRSRNLIRYYYEDKEDMFDAHSYEKGGQVLHMLRRELGDDAFFTGLNKYLQKMQFSSAEIHDLRLSFEEVCGRDLQPFFNPWFLGKGHPVLEVEYSQEGETARVKINQTQESSGGSVYLLNGYWQIQTTDTGYLIPVTIKRRNEVLEVKVKGKMLYADLDPERQWLAVRKDKRTQEQQYRLFSASSFAGNKSDIIQAISEVKGESEWKDRLFERALSDPFWAIRLRAIDAIRHQEVADSLSAKLLELAISDPSAAVRAAAVQWLGNTKKQDFKPTYLKALKDISPRTNSRALIALREIDLAEAVRQADLIRSSNLTDINDASSRVYAMTGDTQYLSLFRSRLTDTSLKGRERQTTGFFAWMVRLPAALFREQLLWAKEFFTSSAAPYQLENKSLLQNLDLYASQVLAKTDKSDKLMLEKVNAVKAILQEELKPYRKLND
jgi:aminopeptidase N